MSIPVEMFVSLAAALVSIATAYSTLKKVRVESAKAGVETQESVVSQYDKLVDRYLAEIKRLIEDGERKEREHTEEMQKLQEGYRAEIGELRTKIELLEKRIAEQTLIIIEQTREIQALKRERV